MNRSEIHIVVIDDEEYLAEIVAEALEMEDFRTSCFLSAEEALPFLDKENCHVVISDAHMPGIGGIELLDKLSETYSKLPFLFYLCTGDMKISLRDLKGKGCHGLIMKPYNLNDLVETLLKDLESHENN